MLLNSPDYDASTLTPITVSYQGTYVSTVATRLKIVGKAASRTARRMTQNVNSEIKPHTLSKICDNLPLC
jgi:hypothetical protein